MAQDKPRAILSFATPNPVGPYRLVTPTNQVQPQQTKTPVLPVMGGTLINTMPPPLPTRTSNTPAQDQGQRKLVNVPKPPMADKLRSNPVKDYWRDRFTLGSDQKIEAAIEKGHEYIVSFDDNSATKQQYLQSLKGQDTAFIKFPYVDNIMGDLDDLMRPGLTKEDAVKILDSLGGSINKPGGLRTKPQREDYAYSVAASYKSLKPKEKETFLALLPEWVGSPDDLANAAKSLSK